MRACNILAVRIIMALALFRGELEDVVHLFLHCQRAVSFWSALGLDSKDFLQVESLWSATLAGPGWPSSKLRSTVLTCLFWNFWKCRSALVFNSELQTNTVIFCRCVADLQLWQCRFRSPADKLVISDWCVFLSSM